MAAVKQGQLVFTGKMWSGRPHRTAKLVPLLTDDKRVARARLNVLLKDPAYTPTAEVESFEELARRVVGRQLREDVPSAPARLSRLERWAFPIVGAMPVTAVRPAHVTSVLEHVAGLGKSSTTLAHMRGDMIAVFARALKDEVISRNPARGDLVDTPRGTDDTRKRVILRDDEFVALIQAPTTPEQLRLMAIVSRAFGGMRTSDLRAWMWEHVDTSRWEHSDVPRPKTSKRGASARGARDTHTLERIGLPPAVAAELHTWWRGLGQPSTGSVFTFPTARKSYAAALRAALLASGVDRHEVHHDTPRSRRVDFHSFRRAWATAIAGANLNAQSAMQLTGHRQMSTHMLYVVPEVRQIPAAALPEWDPRASELRNTAPTTEPNDWDKALESFECEGQDSNLHTVSGASTSINPQQIHTGTEAPHTGTQPHETTSVTEPVTNGSVRFRSGFGHSVAQEKLRASRAACDAALQSYLTTLASSIGERFAHPVNETRGL